MNGFESAEARWAVSAVAAAARLACRVQDTLVTMAMTKSDQSPVTVADYAVQAVICARLLRQSPHAVLVGEEDASDLRSPRGQETLTQVTRFVNEFETYSNAEQVCEWIDTGGAEPTNDFWTLDPIDGTKGFVRRNQFAVALAHIVNGRVQLGVLGCPRLALPGITPESRPGCLLVAMAGQGTLATSLDEPFNWQPVRVSGCQTAAQAKVLGSYEAGHTDEEKLLEVARHLGITADLVRLDSQAKFAMLAAGAGDLLCRLISPGRPDYKEKIWDQAAGSLVVEEAGGRVSDLDGRPLDFNHGRTLATNRGVLASNGLLHDTMLAALKACRA